MISQEKKHIIVIHTAIKNRNPLAFKYHQHPRVVEPIFIGHSRSGKAMLLGIQVGGYSSTGRLPDWRMFEIEKMQEICIEERKTAPYLTPLKEERREVEHALQEMQSLVTPLSHETYDVFKQLESIGYKVDAGVYWYGRDLQYILGYHSWQHFLRRIAKALEQCKIAGHHPDHHFAFITRKDNTGKRVSDIMLSRYACYLLVQQASMRKKSVAIARVYFSLQNKDHVLSNENLASKRLVLKKKLSDGESLLASLLTAQGINETELEILWNQGDKALLGALDAKKLLRNDNGRKTRKGKKQLPAIFYYARELAAVLTAYKVLTEKIADIKEVITEYEINNEEIRNLMIKRGIHMEAYYTSLSTNLKADIVKP